MPRKTISDTTKTPSKVLSAALDKLGKRGLSGLILDLYGMDSRNREFIETRLSLSADPLKPFKAIILDALHDDMSSEKPLSISRAKKAISDYKKASGNKDGELELMIFFVERGTFLTAEYGDFGESFYDSMVRMFEKVVQWVKAGGADMEARYRERLNKIVDSSKDIGYGYHDDLDYFYHSVFSGR